MCERYSGTTLPGRAETIFEPKQTGYSGQTRPPPSYHIMCEIYIYIYIYSSSSELGLAGKLKLVGASVKRKASAEVAQAVARLEQVCSVVAAVEKLFCASPAREGECACVAVSVRSAA
jgi:hypothetical protein